MAVTLLDQLRSVRRFLQGIFPSMVIHLERDKTEFDRPALLVEHLASTSDRVMTRVVEDHASWQISYFGVSKVECLTVVGAIKEALLGDMAIPALLFDFRHPAPTLARPVYEDQARAGLAPGSYEVQVTGIGRDGSESLPSDPVSVVLDGQAAIAIRIPRLFLGIGTFRKYGVYVNGKLVEVIVQDEVGNTDYLITAPGDGQAPPVEAEVLDRHMRLGEVYTATMAEAGDNGGHNGIVRFRTKLISPKYDVVGDKVSFIGMKTSIKNV